MHVYTPHAHAHAHAHTDQKISSLVKVKTFLLSEKDGRNFVKFESTKLFGAIHDVLIVIILESKIASARQRFVIFYGNNT